MVDSKVITKIEDGIVAVIGELRMSMSMRDQIIANLQNANKSLSDELVNTKNQLVDTLNKLAEVERAVHK